MKSPDLESLLAPGRKIALDTSVLIYHFEGNAKYSGLTSLIFARIASGAEAVLSSLAVLELLVRPFQADTGKLANALIAQLKAMPNFSFVPAGFDIAVEAARLRARYALRPPDALHLATATLEGAECFLTNDRDFKAVAGKVKIKILLLEDFL